jgi:hypothetical protein
MPQSEFDPASNGATAVADFDPTQHGAAAVAGFNPADHATPSGFDPASQGARLVSATSLPVAPVGTISQAPDRTLLQRLHDTVANSAIGYALEQGLPKVADALNLHPTETVYSPEYQQHKDQLISPEEMVDPNSQSIPVRVGRGVLGIAGSLTTPANLAIMAGTQGLGLLGDAAPVVSRLVSAGFSLQMIKGAIDQYPQLKDALNKKDYGTAAETLTKMAGTAGLAGFAAKHAATGGVPEVSETPIDSTPDTASPAGVGAEPAKAPIAPDDVDQNTVIPGPGAQNTGTGIKESGSDITQLGTALNSGPKPNVADRMKAALSDAKDAVSPDAIADATSGAVDSVKDAVTSKLDRVKAAGGAMWDAYSHPPDWTDFADSRGKWDYALQRSSHEAMEFAKNIKAGIPDDLTREALVNYIQAGGDDSVLQQRAEASDGDLRKGYEAARALTDEQRIQAQNISNYFDAKLQQAKDSGMLSAGVENYVNQIWDRPNPVTQKLQADVDYGTLRTNPSLLKKRIFGSYFEGEQQGFQPRNKDIGFLVTAYDEAFNKAVAGRAFVKSMLDGSGKDGRPILVANGDRASSITSPEGNVTANLISPQFIGEKYADYRPIDHPALRKWTWIGKDSDGKPIYQNGDLWVHPDVYKELSNNLSNSKLRQIPAVNTVMDTAQKIKGSMLGYSLFHQVQEGVHAIGHAVNPLDVGKIIDFDAPDQKTLIEHGLQISNARAQQEFMDGHTEAYAYRVPVIGRMAQQYSEYLFNDWIPNLKMKTGLDILERNRERYAAKYTPDQIAELSAKQANAAYGELNYRQMGRNKTMQDVFRLLGLAPDFLEARGRFVAQALRPEGAEQRAALIRLTATLYGASRVINMALNNGNPRLDKPFAVTYKDKDYFLRSVPGDIAHLVSDPRSFFYTRLNPVTTKPLIEELTGRDEFGRKRTTAQHFWDTLKGWTPIAVQKWVKNPQDFSPLDSVLQALGLSSTKNYSASGRAARDYVANSVPSGDANAANKSATTRDLQQKHAAGTLSTEQLQQMQQSGEITQKQTRKIASPIPDGVVSDFARLPMEQALDLWANYTPEEQAKLVPALRKKAASINRLDRTSLQKQSLRARATEILAAK